MLDKALDYFDHGYNVIPILSNKKPAIPWKTYQTQKVTYNDIVNWWTVAPGLNIAVVCGAISQVVVVDADDEESIKYCKLHLDPTPFRVKTRKGMHFYYRHPGGRVQNQTRGLLREDGKGKWNIDVKADGGSATGLGSIHQTGYVYQLDDQCEMFSPHDLPYYDQAWFPIAPVKRIMTSKINYSKDINIRADHYVNSIPGVGKGQRNHAAFRVAASLTHDFGLSYETALSLTLGWNLKNDPPLPDSEIAIIVASSERSGRNPIGCKAESIDR
jgi:hypothetical protein